MLTTEQIRCCRRIGRNEAENNSIIGLSELDALCDAATEGLACAEREAIYRSRYCAKHLDEIHGDYITQIRTGCDLCNQAPRWIPVEERLPEPGVRTLVSQEGAAHILVFVGGGWEDDECWYGPATVTHWMLLPEPPE